ncbi:MAG TPA: type IV pilin, partial [Candidatus Bathyarchaeia archaeon]|nr:type IV pilin [Candidatus Bathyarchaeia archaeon]
MKNILKSKRGLSTVVTTLIILVVSVLLATVVTYYAINITTNRMAQESLQMSNLHVWYNTTTPTGGTTGWAEAAFALTNTGGKDVVLQSITTRSQPAAWTNVYYWTTDTATI